MDLLQGRSQTKTDLYVPGNPGELIEISKAGQAVRMGKANFRVVVKQVCLEFTLAVDAGDDVLLHVEFTLGKVTNKSWQAELGSLASLSRADEDSYEIRRRISK
jgi:hydrogenase maturation factor